MVWSPLILLENFCEGKVASLGAWQNPGFQAKNQLF